MFTRPRFAVTTAALASFLLASCGSADGTDTATGAPAATPEAAATSSAAPTTAPAAPTTEPEGTDEPSSAPPGDDELADFYATAEQSIADSAPEELADLCDGLDMFGAEAIVNMALGSAGEDAPDNLDSERLASMFDDACENRPDTTESPAADGETAASDGEAAQIGETQTVGDYEVTLVAFERDATDAVMEMNDFNEPPSNGAYATAEFEVTYVGDTEGDPGFELSYVVVADARQISDSDGSCTTDRLAYDIGTLENGGTGSFIECYDVDPSTIERIFVEELMSFDDSGRATWNIS